MRSAESNISREGTIDQIVASEAGRAHPALKAWCGEAGVRANLKKAIDAAVGGVVPEGSAPAWIAQLATGGAAILTPQDEANRYPLPHLVVEGMSAALVSNDDVRRLADAARDSNAGPSARAVCVFVPSSDSDARAIVEQHPACRPYKRFFAGRLGDLRRADGSVPDSRVELRAPCDFEFFPKYRAIYERFRNLRPDLKTLVPMESLDDLRSYASCGGLRVIEVEGAFAGVLAASPACRHGLSGWCMRERVLAQPFRGRGLGSSILARFVHELPASDQEVLFGAIAPANIASMRSALSSGRIDVGGLYWVRFDDAPDPLLDSTSNGRDEA